MKKVTWKIHELNCNEDYIVLMECNPTWINFVTYANPTEDQEGVVQMETLLRRQYNATKNKGVIEFDSEEDLTLFLLNWYRQ